MSAKLDAKALSILVKQIALAAGEHAIVVNDISTLHQKIKECEAHLAPDEGNSPIWHFTVNMYQFALRGLLAQERRLLEHRDALIEQLRS